ncbi:hypothetical protein GLOIN_2v791405 [Rhizophagus irregularis DAOM 181602=DAOM 197198]|uniref:Uncharacterized protein n=1 Tax=Rhizophagus irregularis (strain DAOM 181602 / DAOM 197198 / MUCL 43194) TaxID=747089 RepID=A0A2P4QIH8_RHIID|nr:hypothetical protein GLOIN_2v791405 [Rhizophagus irregularis DAOM 181602=DAOM 197198]POG77420.1 hypothetical protein GLOIN_2v791405 [Rhizophagus irregularis DAOM 181602=DAOM 197198]|eukprot:XP_025184286.1 hypothetical protein GLOIN_2v791405 [Rhizophagus irregularis DAOM 181602=DAOM 197198]
MIFPNLYNFLLFNIKEIFKKSPYCSISEKVSYDKKIKNAILPYQLCHVMRVMRMILTRVLII